MSAEPARRLHSVDADTGEIHAGGCPGCAERDDAITGLQRDIRGWSARYQALKRDREGAAKGNRLWPRAVELFNYWREKCRHPQSKFTVDRFELVEPLLREYGFDLCKQAIDGAAFDPFITRRKNGSSNRHDGWDLIFRSTAKFEEFCNRAPRRETT